MVLLMVRAFYSIILDVLRSIVAIQNVLIIGKYFLTIVILYGYLLIIVCVIMQFSVSYAIACSAFLFKLILFYVVFHLCMHATAVG
jgi:hypothetical protein